MLNTGRAVQDKITSKEFHSLALDFESEKRLSFPSQEEALEFLVCYLVLLSTGEYPEYDEKKLLNSYRRIRSILEKRKKIYDREFLKKTSKETWFYLQGKTCSME